MRMVFGACMLDLDHRELYHQNWVQLLEPKAFTVLRTCQSADLRRNIDLGQGPLCVTVQTVQRMRNVP